MQHYEYKVIPAPQRGEKVRGAKTTADRFAAALMAVMNDLGREGWDYLRADTLPCEERVGLTGKTSSFLHMLVFRRPLPGVSASLPRDSETQVPAAVSTGPRTTLLASAPEGVAPRVSAFSKPVAVPTLGPASSPASSPAREPAPPGE